MQAVGFLLLLFYFSSFQFVDGLLTCSKCDLTPNECYRSSSTCRGDYCYHAEYFYPNENIPMIQKGCILGDIPSEGCRINHYGNVICFCSDADYCNTNVTEISVTETSTTLLPLQTCRPEKVTTTPRVRWIRPCAGNYCSSLSSQATSEEGNYTWTTKDCNKENEFDIFPTFTVFNFYPNSCVWLEYGGQPNLKACYGSNELDSTLSIDSTIATIQCEVDYFSPRLPYVKTGDYCTGQFCFISATSRGDVYRGCVSSATVNTVSTLKIGYTRSYTGLEQWICDQADCNSDLKSAENSWPPELYLYRNLSNLREFSVFYINYASGYSFFPAFFLVIIICFL